MATAGIARSAASVVVPGNRQGHQFRERIPRLGHERPDADKRGEPGLNRALLRRVFRQGNAGQVHQVHPVRLGSREVDHSVISGWFFSARELVCYGNG